MKATNTGRKSHMQTHGQAKGLFLKEDGGPCGGDTRFVP